ncbi:MAG: hypothetical protein ACHQZR_03940, partial [Candidatus Limnocylindrales bacterium]
DTLTQYCLDCDIRFACNGGCPKDRFATSPYGEPGQHYLCPSYKAFFHHVQRPMEQMRDLLRADRAPAEVMAAYVAAAAQRGRNGRCTCGSGRRWKSCHGRAPMATPGASPVSDEAGGCPGSYNKDQPDGDQAHAEGLTT